jgi:hypothetical protein
MLSGIVSNSTIPPPLDWGGGRGVIPMICVGDPNVQDFYTQCICAVYVTRFRTFKIA